MKKVTCRSCGRTGGEEFRMADGTHRCPECGSSDLHIHVTFSEQVGVHARLGIKGRREDSQKPFREVVAGDDLRRSDGKWMDKRRVIDREVDRYDETVTDPESGEIVHECHEQLSEHRGHGSAKRYAREITEESDGEAKDGS